MAITNLVILFLIKFHNLGCERFYGLHMRMTMEGNIIRLVRMVEFFNEEFY